MLPVHKLIYCSVGMRGPRSSLGCSSGEQLQGAAAVAKCCQEAELRVQWGGFAVDVHGMFVNSLIPSSGVKAAQPSVRADPLAPAYF